MTEPTTESTTEPAVSRDEVHRALTGSLADEPADGRAAARIAKRTILDGLTERAAHEREKYGAFPMKSVVYYLSQMPGSMQRLDPQARSEVFETILATYGDHGKYQHRYIVTEVTSLADAFRISRQTLRRSKIVLDAMTDESLSPELREMAAAACAEMNATGQVTGPSDRIFRAVQEYRKQQREDVGKATRAVAAQQARQLAMLLHNLAGLVDSGDRLLDELLPVQTLIDGSELTRPQIRSTLLRLREARTMLRRLSRHLDDKTTTTDNNDTESEPTA